jgi:hypothetical protein
MSSWFCAIDLIQKSTNQQGQKWKLFSLPFGLVQSLSLLLQQSKFEFVSKENSNFD